MSEKITYLADRQPIDSIKTQMRKRADGGGVDSREIWTTEDEFKQVGWSVCFYAAEQPELTAFVDYGNKTMSVNIPSAHYTRLFLLRVMDNVKWGLTEGRYRYAWLAGEQMKHNQPIDGQEKWSHLYLTVAPESAG